MGRDNNFNRARSRNPPTSPCADWPQTASAATAMHNILLGFQPELSPPQKGQRGLQIATQSSKLPAFPHKLTPLFSSTGSYVELPRGRLLRLNKGSIVTEVFRRYSKCWRWQGLWILVIILQFFSPQEVVFTQEPCRIRPLFTQPDSLLHSHSFFDEKWW